MCKNWPFYDALSVIERTGDIEKILDFKEERKSFLSAIELAKKENMDERVKVLSEKAFEYFSLKEALEFDDFATEYLIKIAKISGEFKKPIDILIQKERLYHISKVCKELGNYDERIKSLEEIGEYHMAGKLAEESGNEKEFRRLYLLELEKEEANLKKSKKKKDVQSYKYLYSLSKSLGLKEKMNYYSDKIFKNFDRREDYSNAINFIKDNQEFEDKKEFYIKKSIEKDEESGRNLFGVSQYYVKKGNLEKAIEVCEKFGEFNSARYLCSQNKMDDLEFFYESVRKLTENHIKKKKRN